MSYASDNIRTSLAILNEFQQPLLEDKFDQLFQGVKGGKELLKMLRSHRIIHHDAEFEEVTFPFFYDQDSFKPRMLGIVIGETGCASIRVPNVMRRLIIKGYEQKAKLSPEYFSTGDTNQLFHFIGNIKKCYVLRNPRPQRPELELRRQNRQDEHFDEEIATQRIFRKIKPVLIPIIKKTFLDTQHFFKQAIDDGDYQTAQMYADAATQSKKFLVLIDRADSIEELPGTVDGFNYRSAFTKSIRQAFVDMNNMHPPHDLLPAPDESAYEIESRKAYVKFLSNAMSNIGTEVKYIIKRIKENCLTGY